MTTPIYNPRPVSQLPEWLTYDEASEALRLVGAFWTALADDSDARLVQLAGASGAYTRERMSMSCEDCARVGITASIDILADGRVGFRCFDQGPVTRPVMYDQSTVRSLRAIVLLTRGAEGWRITGTTGSDDPALAGATTYRLNS